MSVDCVVSSTSMTVTKHGLEPSELRLAAQTISVEDACALAGLDLVAASGDRVDTPTGSLSARVEAKVATKLGISP